MITLSKCRPGVFSRTENKSFGVESTIFITTCFSKTTFYNKVYYCTRSPLQLVLNKTAAVFLTHFTCIDDPAKYICFHKTSLCDPIF